MSHTTTKIFTQTVSGVKYGVSISDIKTVLNSSYGDIGGLITNGSNGTLINQWAKNKPIRSDVLGILTTAMKEDAYYGLYIPIFGTNYTNNLATFLAEYEDGWQYLVPRGKGGGDNGEDEWYRFLDFDGYDHQARSFINMNGCTLPSTFIYNQGAGSINFELGLNPSSQIDDYDSILTTDLKLGGSEGEDTFSELYFGLLFIDNDDSTKRHIVTSASNAPIGDSSSSAFITIAEGNDGLSGLNKDHTYTVYPVLSLSDHSSITNIANTDVFVSLPMSAFSFEQHSAATLTNISFQSASAVSARGRITVNAKIGMQSSTGGLQSIATVRWTIYSASSSGDTTGSQIAIGSVSNLTPSSPQSFSNTIMSTSYTWLRLYAVADGHSDIYTNRWVKVKVGGDDPLGPPPVN